MKKISVMTVVGTRPEIIRLSRLIPLLDEFCDHTLVHTGQNYDYELNGIFFEDLEIRKPDIFLEAIGKSSAQTISNIISEIDKAIDHNRPEAFLVLGDTNSCLSVIAAKRKKIPIFHMEAGNRCFDFRVPEEINRKIVDHISDINLTYSLIAREYLLQEGFPADQIIKTGSPMGEVIAHYKPKIEASEILKQLSIKKEEYFIISAHREENVDSPKMLNNFIEILNSLDNSYKIPIIVSTHPRTRNHLKKLGIEDNSNIRFMKPFSFSDYIQLQINAKCVLSDSGTITEESSILNFPAINLREVHERPEGFEEGSVMFTGMDTSRVLQALKIIEKQPRGNHRLLKIVPDYNVNNVSHKVLRIIQSYTDFVNKKIWKK
jgi:UDP-N-acetylglucosamine 2-epimerase (non-hydrolysing)